MSSILYDRNDNYSKEKLTSGGYLIFEEEFDTNALYSILQSREAAAEQLRDSCTENEYDPFSAAEKLLMQSRNGKIRVKYRQNDGKGRMWAVGAVSMQGLTREFRHSIAKDIYTDIDMVNAHPVILAKICDKLKIKCDNLKAYNADRESKLSELGDDREAAKKAFLSLLNGGKKAAQEVNATPFLDNFKYELMAIHSAIASKFKEEYKEHKEKRKAEKKDFNLEASFVNCILCDFENRLLMCIWRELGSPSDAVLCFDGIMIKKNLSFDLSALETSMKREYDIDMKLKIKGMDEGIKNIPSAIYKEPELQFYSDFRDLVKLKQVPEDTAIEWMKRTIKIIENKGEMIFMTRNRIYDEDAKRYATVWQPKASGKVFSSLAVDLDIINRDYDPGLISKYEGKKKSEIPFEDKQRMRKIAFNTLGGSMIDKGSLLRHMVRGRLLDSHSYIDFIPYLKRSGKPKCIDENYIFNLFEGFPFEDETVEGKLPEFENSLLYQHILNDFCNGDMGEFNHLLDHIADIIQKPGAKIRGTGHVFYSRQGCGKGMVLEWMTRMLGSVHVAVISNIKRYFDKFNTDTSNKLLKAFEEVSEKGDMFHNHNRLKAEITSPTERIEPKGLEAYQLKHYARYWFNTNNDNAFFVEADGRRLTFHRISDKHANDKKYFAPIWEEIASDAFIKSSFEYFADRKYDVMNVISAYDTAYKREQKQLNLPLGIQYIKELIEDNFMCIPHDNNKIKATTLHAEYKAWCNDNGCRFNIKAFKTQIQRIGVLAPKCCKVNGVVFKGYEIDPEKIEVAFGEFLKDPTFKFNK